MTKICENMYQSSFSCMKRNVMVESLPKLHNLFTIVIQRKDVPGLRITIFHLEHKFRSGLREVFVT